MVRVRQDSSSSNANDKQSKQSAVSPRKDGDSSVGSEGAASAAISSSPKESNNNKAREKDGGDRARNTSPTLETLRSSIAREEGQSSSRSYYSSHKKYMPYRSYPSSSSSSSWNHHHHSHNAHQHHYGGYDGGDSGASSSWGASSSYGGSYSYPQATSYYDLTGANGGGSYFNPTGGSTRSYYGYGHLSKRRGSGAARGRTYHSGRSTTRQQSSPNSHASVTVSEPCDDSLRSTAMTAPSSPASMPAAVAVVTSSMSPTNVAVVVPVSSESGDQPPSGSAASPTGNNYYHRHHHHHHHESTVTVEEVSDNGVTGQVVLTSASVMGDGAAVSGATLAMPMPMPMPAGASVASSMAVSPAATVEAMGACGILTPLTAPNGAVGQIVHLHIGLGEAMQFQVGDQVQLVSGDWGRC